MRDGALVGRVPGQDRALPRARGWWAEEVRLAAGGALVGVLALAAALRFARLGQHSAWMDEAFTLWVIRFPWQDIPRLLRLADSHPPLFYLLMKAWAGVAGTSDLAARIPSAFLGCLCVPLAYALARRVSAKSVSLLTALLVSISPYQVMASQEARMYALLAVLALASTLALASSVERGGAPRWAAYAILSTLMAYTQYLGLLVLAAHGAWVGWHARRRLLPWLAGTAAVAVMYSPWVPVLLAQASREGGWIGSPYHAGISAGAARLGGVVGLFAFGGSLFGMPSFFFVDTPLGIFEELLLLSPFLVLLWRGAASFSTDRRGLALIGLPLAVPVGVLFALSLGTPRFQNWWFSSFVPFSAVLLARGLGDVARRVAGERRARALALLTAWAVAYSVPVLVRDYVDPASYPFQWRQAAVVIEARARPGDLLLFADGRNAFVNADNKLALTRYFPARAPALAYASLDRPVDPATAAQLPPGYLLDRVPRLDPETVARLAHRHPRVWLIVAPPLEDLTPALSALRRSYRLAGESRLNGTRTFPWVYLFDATAPPGR